MKLSWVVRPSYAALLSSLVAASVGNDSTHLNPKVGRELTGLHSDKTTHNRNITALKERLLQGYAMDTPPHNCTVYVQMAIQQIPEINTQQQFIKMSAFWRHYWKDLRLTWNPDDWGGLSFLTFKALGIARQLWTPDDVIYETLDEVVNHEDIDLSVYSTGDIFISFPKIYTLPCPMNLTDFPFDTQRCQFTLGSWSNHGLILDLQARRSADDKTGVPVDLSYFKQPGSFLLNAVDVERKVTVPTCCPEPYPAITFTLVLQRQPLMYTCGIILPMVLVTIIGFSGYVLNPTSGERVGLGVTVMLTTTAVYLVANEAMPAIGIYTTVVHLYLISLFVSALTMLTSVMVVSLHNVRNSEGLASEAALLALFVKEDKDDSGDLDAKQLRQALMDTGLADKHLDKLCEYVSHIPDDKVSFEQWYDLVSKFCVSDGLASCHCHIYQVLLSPFMSLERKLRKDIISRRARALSAELRVWLCVRQSSMVDHSAPTDCPPEPSLRSGGALPGWLDGSPPTAPSLSSQPEAPASKVSPFSVINDAKPDLVSPCSHKELDKRVPVITERDLADPTEIVARRMSGIVDSVMVIVVPVVYISMIAHALMGRKVWTLNEHVPDLLYVDRGIVRA